MLNGLLKTQCLHQLCESVSRIGSVYKILRQKELVSTFSLFRNLETQELQTSLHKINSDQLAVGLANRKVPWCRPQAQAWAHTHLLGLLDTPKDPLCCSVDVYTCEMVINGYLHHILLTEKRRH